MRASRQRGIAYLLVLLAVFLLALGVGRAVDSDATSAQREREEELIELGRMYRSAIGEYYHSAPSGKKSYPASLEDLLKDARHAVTRRYIRRLALDPVTGQAFVPLLAPHGGVWGVASSSSAAPLRTLVPIDVVMASSGGQAYKDWQFIYAPTP